MYKIWPLGGGHGPMARNVDTRMEAPPPQYSIIGLGHAPAHNLKRGDLVLHL